MDGREGHPDRRHQGRRADAWYDTGRNEPTRDAQGSTLTVETDRCVIRLTASERADVTRADLEALVADMAIGDCADLDTWIAPLS